MIEILKVIVIDDDGLDIRYNVFNEYYTKLAISKNKILDLVIFTSFPDIDLLVPADVVSWDNDLGDGIDVISKVRQFQWEDYDKLYNVLSNKTHIIHSMNQVASDNLYNIFNNDFKFETYKIPFILMKGL